MQKRWQRRRQNRRQKNLIQIRAQLSRLIHNNRASMQQLGPTDAPYLSSFACSSFSNSLIIAKTLKQFLPNPSITRVKQATLAFVASKIAQVSRTAVLDSISANTTVVKITRSQLAALRPLTTSSLSSIHNTRQWIIAPECPLT